MPEIPTADLCAVFAFPVNFLRQFVLESIKGETTPARADLSEVIGKRKGRSMKMWVILIFISWSRCPYFLPYSPKTIYKAVSIWAWLNVETPQNLFDFIPPTSSYSNVNFLTFLYFPDPWIVGGKRRWGLFETAYVLGLWPSRRQLQIYVHHLWSSQLRILRWGGRSCLSC